MQHTYDEAVLTLNSLQFNATSTERVKQRKHENRDVQMSETVQMAGSVGVTLDMIDKLSIIHVSGTKGKGSTCAYCECILRNHGYKTGFFSSPHLVEVRERIRINGKPLSSEAFTTYFWDCYQKLEKNKAEFGGEMPTYFRFLTIMAFHVFVQEKVDVAVIEVGIGGQYDYTNIVRSPVVCGVSSLGLDHVKVLGSTLEQIAWHKAGIFKPGVPAVTVPQPEGCIQVLKERASEIGNPLYLAPSYSAYDWGGSEPCKLGIDGEMQQVNASLALQLSHIWLQNHSLDKNARFSLYSAYGTDRQPKIEDGKIFRVSDQSKTGLEGCKWPGRNQKVVRSRVTYYIDGAHTSSSVQQCVHWFIPEAKREATEKGSVARVMMFNLNVAGNRDAVPLLKHLLECDFDCAVFCPNIACLTHGTDKADQRNYMAPMDAQMAECKKNRNLWIKLTSEGLTTAQKTCLQALHQPTMLISVVNNSYRLCIGRTSKQRDSTTPAIDDKISQDETSKKDIDEPVVLTKTSEAIHEAEASSKQSDTKKLAQSRQQDNSTSATYNDLGLSAEKYLDGKEEINLLFKSIEEAVHWISQGGRDPKINKWAGPEISPAPKVLREAEHVQVLCLGSLHLVGGIFKVLNLDVDA